MESAERQIGLITEMALGAPDLRSFELAWIELLRPSIGFETACSIWTDHTGASLGAAALGYPEATLRGRFSAYMSELSRREVAAFSSARPIVDTDLMSLRRRQELTVYRELLIPANVSCFVTNVWHSRWGVFGVHLARCGVTRTFRARDLDRLGRVLGSVKLGQALLAAEELRVSADVEWWGGVWGLSPKELEVARLVARGFHNPEIARLLRSSRYTVRNHLVSVFRKAAVSTRTELVFAMNAPRALAANFVRHRGSSSRAWSGFLASARAKVG